MKQLFEVTAITRNWEPSPRGKALTPHLHKTAKIGPIAQNRTER
jgi:hypothetical protein